MKEEDFKSNIVKLKLVNKSISEESVDKINKLCCEWYMKGYKKGRFDEQMSFLKQADKQLSIIKKLKYFLKSSKDFKALNYLERLEKEQR